MIKKLNRRRLIKSGFLMWSTPLVSSVVLPVHAQASVEADPNSSDASMVTSDQDMTEETIDQDNASQDNGDETQGASSDTGNGTIISTGSQEQPPSEPPQVVGVSQVPTSPTNSETMPSGNSVSGSSEVGVGSSNNTVVTPPETVIDNTGMNGSQLSDQEMPETEDATEIDLNPSTVNESDTNTETESDDDDRSNPEDEDADSET